VELGDAILDGRNRYRACNQAGVPIKTKKYTGTDPLAYVVSANLHRRHLNESQRGMIALAMANMPSGYRTDLQPSANLPKVSQADAAKMVGVSTRSVTSAAAVRDKGTPELVERVKRGEVAVSLAAKVAELPKQEQQNLANADEGSLRSAVKKSKRAEREQSGGQAQANENADRTLNNRTFGAIYIDPPWRFETFSDAGKDRSADNHYDTLSIAEIRERKPPVAKNCVVFMWTTGPMLAEAIQLLKDWGLTYKARFIWRKPTAGTGFWQRDNAEELLVATIGNVVAPAPGTQSLAAIDAPTEKHSQKPAVFAEMIERLFPNTPKLEMYARPPFRAAWTVWGNEVPGGIMEVTRGAP
jgi:N6-adenosine-specific RNA methylase IME4